MKCSVRKACAAALGAALGFATAEGGLRVWNRSAYPHLNIYTPDPVFGVRLRATSHARVRSRGGQITEISTNSLGFRGGEWPPPAPEVVPGRVLLLGDSQMFGYGVDVAGTLPLALERESAGRLHVLNAAVPTWGPREYLAAMRDLVPRYRPAHVVFVANLANDWFEAPVPNTRRTTARNGWAVSYDNTARLPSVLSAGMFDGSQLVAKLRTLWRAREPAMSAHTADVLWREWPKLERPVPGFRSRLGPHLTDAHDVCAAHGCNVIAAVLPVDVMVHPQEWRKYRSTRRDMGPLQALTHGLRADAERLNLPCVDLLPALRAASPGAFQDDDYHLSANGHAAVARALAEVIP